MQRIEYRNPTVDKLTAFGPGPWVDEVDKVQWQDDATGLPCLVKRNHMGAWCGYVGVSKGHPLFEDTDAGDQVDPHGGVTFTGFCQPHGEGEEWDAICHVVDLGEDDRVWWIGFDCAHYADLVPFVHGTGEFGSKLPSPVEITYRDLAYVTDQTVQLARDLHELDTLSLQSSSSA